MQLSMILTYLGRPSPYLGKERYHDYLSSEVWRRKRARVIERDGFQCTQCRNTESLQVHHLTYRYIGRERLCDLVTLCDACHKRVHAEM